MAVILAMRRPAFVVITVLQEHTSRFHAQLAHICPRPVGKVLQIVYCVHRVSTVARWEQ